MTWKIVKGPGLKGIPRTRPYQHLIRFPKQEGPTHPGSYPEGLFKPVKKGSLTAGTYSDVIFVDRSRAVADPSPASTT